MHSPKRRYGVWRAVIVSLGILTLDTCVAHAAFVPIAQPDAAYLSESTLMPFSAADFDVVSSLSSGSFSVTFDTDLVALTVPTTWASWGTPPNVESSTPRVLWTNGATSLTLTFTQSVELFGIEAQPNTSVVSSIDASFFAGANLVGEIAMDVDGDGGARLFAASSTTPFDKVVLTSTDDFAIAQVRAGIVPEPSSLTMLVLGSVIVATAARKRIGLKADRLRGLVMIRFAAH
jgi:hypothetical protein